MQKFKAGLMSMRLNESYAERVGICFFARFSESIETTDGESVRVDGKAFSQEEAAWLMAFADGYGAAIEVAIEALS